MGVSKTTIKKRRRPRIPNEHRTPEDTTGILNVLYALTLHLEGEDPNRK